MEIDAGALSVRDAYALLTSVIVPRPIAWVTTQEPSGHVNLAPFSYFNGIGSDPPLLSLAVSDRKGGVPKDTLRIARATGVLCVNMVEEADAALMNATSEDFTPDISETEHCGVPTAPCARIPCVRVASARVSLECRLVDVHRYGRRTTVNLMVCEVLHAHVDDAIWSGNAVDPTRIRPLARLGQDAFASLGPLLHLARPRAGG